MELIYLLGGSIGVVMLSGLVVRLVFSREKMEPIRLCLCREATKSRVTRSFAYGGDVGTYQLQC